MGCHTWFYKKLEKQPTWSEIKKNNEERLLHGIKLYQDMINGTLHEDLKEAYPEWDANFGKENIVYLQAELKTLKDEKISTESKLYFYHKFDEHRVSFFNEFGFYTSIDTPHNLFRIHNYPEVKLLSLNETLAFIEKHKHIIDVYDYTIERLNEFWKDHPDGIIDFG